MADITKMYFNILKREGLFVTYIFADEEQFSQVGYKVMKSQEGVLFVASAKVKYNGHIKLIYATEGHKSMADICKNETAEIIGYCLQKTVDGIRQICENGFLDYVNIIMAFQYIYFDESLENPYFIYLPLAAGERGSKCYDFETKFSDEIITHIKYADQLSEMQKQDFLSELGEVPYSLDRISRYCSKYSDYKEKKQKEMIAGGVCIVSMEKELPLKFVIKGERFTIGRRKDNDGILDFSKQISRLHCTILKQNGRYGVVDENSKFGTRINSVVCKPGKFYELCIGDELNLPAITFKVQEESWNKHEKTISGCCRNG